MPILIKDFTWRQTKDYVIIRVPLQNVSPSKVDLFASNTYIKVHCPPFFFEACLYAQIDDDQSKCVLVKGEAVFELLKCEDKEWPSLVKDVSKTEAIIIKQEAIERAHRKAEEAKEKKSVAKNERRRECVKQQIDLNSKNREGIEAKKKVEKEAAVSDVLTWKEKDTDDDKTLLPLWKKMSKELKLTPAPKIVQTITEKSLENKTEKSISVPAPRSFGKISCKFTPRSFPTPCRESRLGEEEEWLKKQAEARRATGFMEEDLRPEENDPHWLLEKGRSFHRVNNYLGAVSVYTYAIKIWNKIPELYVARALSQVELGNWRRVLKDTTEALELCKPHVAANAEMRFFSHLNRGKALLEIGKAKAAMADFVEAMEIKPYYPPLEHLMDRAEKLEEEQKQENQEIKKENDQLENSYIEPEDLAN